MSSTLPQRPAPDFDLAERARSKRLAPDEVTGGTFTITNPGQYGTLMQVPIINQPQVAILSTDGIRRRPVVVDGPDDDGEMFERPGIPSDYFPSPFPNAKAAAAANGGAVPPDLSLMAKARIGGPDYTYAILTGYGDPPAGFDLMEGLSYNKYFPGHQIAMAPPLFEDGVEFADGTPATVGQMATDVSVFLMWAAGPNLEDRKQMGIKVILFLIVFTGVLYAVKRKVWADLH